MVDMTARRKAKHRAHHKDRRRSAINYDPPSHDAAIAQKLIPTHHEDRRGLFGNSIIFSLPAQSDLLFVFALATRGLTFGAASGPDTGRTPCGGILGAATAVPGPAGIKGLKGGLPLNSKNAERPGPGADDFAYMPQT